MQIPRSFKLIYGVYFMHLLVNAVYILRIFYVVILLEHNKIYWNIKIATCQSQCTCAIWSPNWSSQRTLTVLHATNQFRVYNAGKKNKVQSLSRTRIREAITLSHTRFWDFDRHQLVEEIEVILKVFSYIQA